MLQKSVSVFGNHVCFLLCKKITFKTCNWSQSRRLRSCIPSDLDAYIFFIIIFLCSNWVACKTLFAALFCFLLGVCIVHILAHRIRFSIIYELIAHVFSGKMTTKKKKRRAGSRCGEWHHDSIIWWRFVLTFSDVRSMNNSNLRYIRIPWSMVHALHCEIVSSPFSRLAACERILCLIIIADDGGYKKVEWHSVGNGIEIPWTHRPSFTAAPTIHSFISHK